MRYVPLAVCALLAAVVLLGWVAYLRNHALRVALRAATDTLDAIEAKTDEYHEIDSVLAGAVKTLLRAHRNPQGTPPP